MKKFLKIISSIAAFALVASILPTTIAASKGWAISYVDVNEKKNDHETYYMKITDDSDLASGESVLYVNYGGTVADGMDDYAEAKISLNKDLVVGNTYTLSFKAKGFFTNTGTTGFGKRYPQMAEFYVGDADKFIKTDITDSTALSNSWYSYTKSFTYTGTKSYVAIRVYGCLGNTHDSCFDYVSVTDSEGNEYVPDPDFNNEEDTSDVEEEFDTTDYQASNVKAYPNATQCTVEWTNPATDELKSVKLYELTGNTYTQIASNLDTTSAKACTYSFGSLDQKTTLNLRKFKLEFNYKTKKSFYYYCTMTPTSAETVKGELGFNWQLGKNNSGEMTAARYCVRRANDNPYEGNYYMDSSLPVETAAMDISVVIAIPMSETLKEGSKYRVTFARKTKGAGYSHCYIGGEPTYYASTDLGYAQIWTNHNITNTSWEVYTNDITAGTGYSNLFFIHFGGDICIDDVSVCEILEDGNLGKNLAKYGDCEGNHQDTDNTIEDASFSDVTSNSMTLNYECGADAQYVNVYVKKFDNYEYRGSVDATSGSIFVDGLSMGDTYSVILKPVSYDGVEGKEVSLSQDTYVPEFVIDSTKLSKSGTTVSSITTTGTYTVTTKLYNYKVKDMPLSQIIAVYQNGVLQKVYKTDEVFPIQELGSKQSQITTDFVIGEGTGWTAEVYIWDSIERMNTVSNYIEY